MHARSELIGGVIDRRFEVEQEIAAGGMGRIFQAHDRQTGKPVAIKIMQPDDQITIARFVREAVLLAEVRHPGVVEYIAHGALPEGERYLVMEWLAGIDLATRLAGSRCDGAATQRSRPGELAAEGEAAPPAVGLPVVQVVALARRLASALGEVHRLGIVHRDLKPSNVFLVGGNLGHAKLIDFGTARETAGARPLTASGVLVGTPYYMAPEQVKGGALGPPVDVWALACVLYECLAGRAPFTAANPLAALARIVIEDAPWIERIRPDCPGALAGVIHACLAKDPAARPANGDAVAALLKQVDSGVIAGASLRTTPAAGASGLRLTTSETWVASLLFVRCPAAADTAAVRAVAADHGGAIEAFADGGTLLITSTDVRVPKDQAARAARLALAIREVAPAATLVVATGRGGDRGEVVDGAVASLERAAAGEIFVDKLTAGLLEGRFELRSTPDQQQLLLVREHLAEAARTLLGKPSRWVGRRRELTTLTAILDEASDDRVARAVLVTAPAGIGKSRLCRELLRSIAGRDVEVLHGHGDALSAGSPFAMIGPAVRRSAGVLDGEPAPVRRAKLRARIARALPPERQDRVAALIGALVGVPQADGAEDEALRAARGDPMLMGELMRGAWEEWLRAECSERPVLLVLEDLHWGDLPSVTYVDAALRALADQPLMVLALARPEIHAVFPRLWESRGVQEIRLTRLGPKACSEIIAAALGERAPPPLIDQIVARCEGNAFYLEELIRAVAEGAADTLPDSVIGMVQARLAAFDLEARRVLRAAAVFGEVFWEGGVRALLGDDAGAFDVHEWLADLERREVVAACKDSRLPGEHEYQFRHALVRDAAYEMLTDDDRALGHRLAGGWLEDAGETDALALGGHFERGRVGARAVHWLRRAAEEALEGNDLERVIEHGDRAVAAGATGDALGAIRALQSVAAYWRSAYGDSLRFGEAARELLAPGTINWFKATGSALVSCARLGDFDAFDRLFEPALAAVAATGAEAAQLICLCRGTFQLIFNGRFARADEVLARIVALAAAAEVDALTRAQVEHVQGVRAAHVGDVHRFLHHLEAAVDAFERAGDVRNVSLERTTIAWCWAEIGDTGRAEALCRANLEHCLELRAPQAVTYARVNLGYILSLRPDLLDEARAELRTAIDECRAVGNQRLEGWATAHLAATELAGDPGAAFTLAHAASALLASAPGLCAWAQALEALALVELGRAAEALPLARAAVAVLDHMGGLLQSELLPLAALAAALAATGDHDGARAALADARARLERRAARVADPTWRARFLALPDSVRILERTSG